MKGYMNQILKVDLSAESIEVSKIGEDILKKYIGGSGLGAKILWDMKAYEHDPLSEKSPLIFMTGPFANTRAITSGRYAVVGRSPLTGLFAESDSGGTWGPALKRAGYDGLVVTGKSKKPVYLWVSEDKVEIRDASHIWGKDTIETDALLRAETKKKAVVACIGPAGEKQVLMASVINDGKAARAAGRCGLGALMGSKNLKAVVAFGSLGTPVHDEQGLQESTGRLAKQLKENMVGMGKFGTGALVTPAEELGSLPLKNWKGNERWTEEAAKITGTTMAETILSGRYGCERCVVRCGRDVKFTDERYGELDCAGPEYETLGSLGSLCLVSDLNAICMGNDLCNRYGIDTISAGTAVAFAMEAFEEGIITTKDTGGLEVNWGSAEAMVEIIKMIGESRGLGAVLGKGVRLAARELGHGSEKFAVHAHGLEAPMHDPRSYVSLGLGYTTSNRGACHVAGLSHAFERAITMPEIGYPEVLDRMAEDGKAEMAAKAQHVMGMLDSLKVCKFMLFGKLSIPDMGGWYESITGRAMSVEDFMLAGERIFNIKRLFNLMCGLSPADDVVLTRIQDTPKQAEGWITKLTPFPRLIKEYYQAREWSEEGLPVLAKLKSLDLENEGEVLRQAGKM